jgi:threonyl-tRNA synthetase
VNVSIEGQVVEVAADASFRDALREVLSGKKFKTVLAAKCGTTTLDLTATIPTGCEEITPVYVDTPEGLDLLRHSTAHIMADAVKRLFPSAKVTIGPSIENGFYYDFDVERPFSPEDLEAIEAEMTKIIREAAPFTCEVVSKDEAKKLFADMGESYKLELIDAIDDEVVSIYRHGEFADLCRGPHLPTTGYVKSFKLMSVAGAYWRGDEKNQMLSRIYGTAFADPKELKKYLHRLEEAKKRDHRKLGAALDLFSFQEEGGVGMAYWHPKGALVRTILEDFERKEHLKRGYDIVQAPQILKRELWERSGYSLRSVDGRCRSNPRGGWLVNNETPSFDYCNTNSL